MAGGASSFRRTVLTVDDDQRTSLFRIVLLTRQLSYSLNAKSQTDVLPLQTVFVGSCLRSSVRSGIISPAPRSNGQRTSLFRIELLTKQLSYLLALLTLRLALFGLSRVALGRGGLLWVHRQQYCLLLGKVAACETCWTRTRKPSSTECLGENEDAA